MRKIAGFLLIAMLFVACDSNTKHLAEIETERDFLYSPLFVNSNGQNSLTAAAAVGIVNAVIGTTRFISGLVMNSYDNATADKYETAIADIKNQVQAVSEQVAILQSTLKSLMTEYKLSDQFQLIESEIVDIQSVIDLFVEMMGCKKGSTDYEYCISVYLPDLMKSDTKKAVGASLDKIDNYIDVHFSSNFYRLVSQHVFDDRISNPEEPVAPEKAALDAFSALMQVYAYISSAQMEGYLYILNWYNANGWRDNDSLSHRPQDFIKVMLKQTQLFWTEIERISIYGLNYDANAGGVRLDFNQGQEGWINWYERRIFQDSSGYTGNMLYFQADALAKAMNEWDQLMVVRTIFDPSADEYYSLEPLKTAYESLRTTAPTIELGAISDKTANIHFDYATEKKESVVLELTGVPDSHIFQLWRQVDSDLTFPYEWVPQECGNIALNDIFVLDGEHMWAVGDSGTIVFYDGTEWRAQNSGTGENLRGVFALDLKNVWAVGDKGTVLFCNAAAVEPTWEQQESGTSHGLNGVSGVMSMADAPYLWAVGNEGTIIFYDGSEWRDEKSGTSRLLRGVSALSTEQAWAVGNGGTILHRKSEEGGAIWVPEESGTTSASLYGVSVMNGDNVWAAGVTIGNKEMILFYDGEKWSTSYSGDSGTIYDVKALGEDRVWASGNHGLILFFDGETWANQQNDASHMYYHLLGISGIGGNQIWAVGEDGTADYEGVILHKVEDKDYNPKWKISYQNPKESRPYTFSPKAWGEYFLADRWWVGGSYPDPVHEDYEDLYMNVFSLPFLAYFPECLMTDAEGGFASKSSALVPNQHINLIGEEDRYLRERMKVSAKYIRYQVITSPGCLDYCVWEMLPNSGTRNVLACKASYYIQNTHFEHYVKNTWTTYGDLRNILVSTSPTSASNGFSIYNAVSSNVIKLLDLNDSLVFQNDDIFLYNPEPEPYGIITYEVGVGGYIRGKSLPNILDTKNITDKNNGYFPSKWKITAASSN